MGCGDAGTRRWGDAGTRGRRETGELGETGARCSHYVLFALLMPPLLPLPPLPPKLLNPLVSFGIGLNDEHIVVLNHFPGNLNRIGD